MTQRPCVFLERDGVINVSPAEGECVRSWEDFWFIPTITDWIRLVNALDYLVVVLTNQSGVARGMVSLNDLEDIHANMIDELARRGARVDGVIYCPHAAGSCECHKPRPGMVWEAKRRWTIDMTRSVILGEAEDDWLLAEACGLPFVRVGRGQIRDIIPSARASGLLK